MRRRLIRIIIAIALFAACIIITETGALNMWVEMFVDAQIIPALIHEDIRVYVLAVEFVMFLIPYIIGGYDVVINAIRGLAHGRGLDENFLMFIASVGAFALVFFPNSEPHMEEGCAVILFYQVGELFQDYAVGRSRRSIEHMMEIVPEFANVMNEGELIQVDPGSVAVNDEIIIKPGERIPLDGVIISGESQIDTAALTGESVPRSAHAQDEVISGCVNLTGVLTVRVTKPFADSTVNRILELVENASERKARTENFITRFARYYTPIVVAAAVLLAVIPPLTLGLPWVDWVERGLIFLVVSCPCAFVISVPMSFFGGIGGASRLGILVKGSNFLEALSKTNTVVFDKTGTLTEGTFTVTHLHSESDYTDEELLAFAANAEAYSNHPIAASIREALEQSGQTIEQDRIGSTQEISGQGVKTEVDNKCVLVGNSKLMKANSIDWVPCEVDGTELYIAVDGKYVGHIVIADTVKPDSRKAIADLHSLGINKIVMLTGDHENTARTIANDLGIDKYYAELLPQDKVAHVEELLEETAQEKKTLAFVGDGINDAPVLARADVGIAMGALGSDAAIEAADIVLMDDKPLSVGNAILVSRKTMRIVWQNIIFALGIKLLVLVLAVFGIATMWLAVFADVGVAAIAILNAMRSMRVSTLN